MEIKIKIKSCIRENRITSSFLARIKNLSKPLAGRLDQ